MQKKSLGQLFNLIMHGKYSFDAFTECNVEKEIKEVNVKSRVVYSASDKLKSFHNFINMVINEQLKVNSEVVFSYRKGTSSLAAIQSHKTSKYFFQTDIFSFFPSVNRELIKKTIISSKDEIPVSDLEIHLEKILDMVCVDNSLATGFSTSPLISNSVLFDFDNAFEQYCKENGLIYTRYSDDIIVSSVNEIGSNIDSVISNILKDNYGNSFSLNHSKNRHSHSGQRVKILGLIVLPNGEVTIDKNQKKDIEVLLHFYREDRERFRDMLGDDIDKGLSRISGTLNYIKVSDEKYLHKLMKKYGVTVIDTLMHKASM